MSDLLDLVRRLGLDQPEAWNPTTPPPATVAPDFRARNQFDPMTGEPVVAAPTDIVLPHEEPLTGWRGAVDTGLNALVGTVKGVTGMGDQGPAGATWANFGALAAGVPLGVPEAFLGALAKKLPRFAAALKTYRAPTEAAALRTTHPPGTFFHGSPQAYQELQPGSMFSNEPVWAAGYTTQFDPHGRESFGGPGRIHTLTVPEGPVIAVRTVHGAETELLNQARRVLGREPATLKEAATAVHEATGIVAIVAENKAGVRTGGIVLRPTGVGGHVDPVGALHEATAAGTRIPENLASILPPLAAQPVVRPAAPFYSRLDEAAAALPGKFGAGALSKGTVSTEELIARGVPEFLAAQGTKPIAKGAMEAHLAAHPVPGLQVKVLGAPPPPMLSVQRGPSATGREGYRVVNERTGELLGFAEDYSAARTIQDELGTALSQGAPKFSQYQLPGGTNYRETLITLPEPQATDLLQRQATLQAELTALQPQIHAANQANSPDYYGLYTRSNALKSELAKVKSDIQSTQKSSFRSSHFDEPNILAHTRSNEREIPGLGTGTFLEEVQSDWHQKGKDIGYGPKTQTIAYYDTPSGHIPIGYGESEAAALANSDPNWKNLVEVKYKTEKIGEGVPDAPFKESWPDLALKHHLAEAAQNPETQWIGFTSGSTQAARYDLSKQVSKVMYDESSHTLTAWDNPGRIRDRRMVMQETVTPDKLADYIGKEAADKLRSVTPDDEGTRILEGLDLQVGGEGMRKFYDELLPKRLEKIVKPYGGTVERLQPQRSVQAIKADMDALVANTGDFGPAFTQAFDALEAEKQRALVDPKLTGSWILRLTPELKQRILRYGLPLLTGVAAVEAGREVDPSVFPAQEAS